MKEKRDFDEFWKMLTEALSIKQTIRNWTAKNEYTGEDFTAVYVLDHAKKEKERIEMNVPSAKNPIIPVKKHSFKNVYPLWDGYIKGTILRKEIRDITRHSKYIISTMHQFENLMYK